MLKQKAMAVYVGFAVFMNEEVSLAAQNGGASAAKQNLRGIIRDGAFDKAVTLAFAILALWKWIEFFQGFKPDSALKDAVVPALLTFMAFSWIEVLGWVGM